MSPRSTKGRSVSPRCSAVGAASVIDMGDLLGLEPPDGTQRGATLRRRHQRAADGGDMTIAETDAPGNGLPRAHREHQGGVGRLHAWRARVPGLGAHGRPRSAQHGRRCRGHADRGALRSHVPRRLRPGRLQHHPPRGAEGLRPRPRRDHRAGVGVDRRRHRAEPAGVAALRPQRAPHDVPRPRRLRGRLLQPHGRRRGHDRAVRRVARRLRVRADRERPRPAEPALGLHAGEGAAVGVRRTADRRQLRRADGPARVRPAVVGVGWRSPLILVAVMAVVLGVLSLRLREPSKGGMERRRHGRDRRRHRRGGGARRLPRGLPHPQGDPDRPDDVVLAPVPLRRRARAAHRAAALPRGGVRPRRRAARAARRVPGRVRDLRPLPRHRPHQALPVLRQAAADVPADGGHLGRDRDRRLLPRRRAEPGPDDHRRHVPRDAVVAGAPRLRHPVLDHHAGEGPHGRLRHHPAVGPPGARDGPVRRRGRRRPRPPLGPRREPPGVPRRLVDHRRRRSQLPVRHGRRPRGVDGAMPVRRAPSPTWPRCR